MDPLLGQICCLTVTGRITVSTPLWKYDSASGIDRVIYSLNYGINLLSANVLFNSINLCLTSPAKNSGWLGPQPRG